MSRRISCAVIALLLAWTGAGLADDATTMLPDARKAYLVLGATVRPEEQAQPKWIQVVRQSGIRLAGSDDLSTDRAIFELSPGRYNVRELNFRDNPNSSVDVRRFRNLPYVTLEAGKIYYYGQLVLDESGEDPHIRTEFDAGLHQRACKQAPLVFGMFKMEWLFPDMQSADGQPGCGASARPPTPR